MTEGDRVEVYEADEDRTVPDGTQGTVLAETVVGGEHMVCVRLDDGSERFFFADELVKT